MMGKKEVTDKIIYLKRGMGYLIETLGYGGKSKIARKLGVTSQYIVNLLSLKNSAIGSEEKRAIICKTLGCSRNMMEEIGKYLHDQGFSETKMKDIDIEDQMLVAADVAKIRGFLTVYKLSRKNLRIALETVGGMQKQGGLRTPEEYASFVMEIYERLCKEFGYVEDAEDVEQHPEK